MASPKTRFGKSFLNQDILEFIEDLHAPQSEALLHAEAELERSGMPQIQVSPTDGRILQFLMSLISAEKVLEFGTLSGYSALWLLMGMRERGKLWTVEMEHDHAEVARGVFERAGLSDRVQIIEGSGMDKLEELATYAPFDAVFIDADKENYGEYARFAWDHLKSGGLIIGDNAYLFGYLAGKKADLEQSQESIDGMRDFHMFLSENCLSVSLPTAEGMLVGMKPEK